jgi:isopentenyl-diphosphate Delta-isomerase
MRHARKLSHIVEATKQIRPKINSFDEMEIVHQSISDVNYDDITLNVDAGELSLGSPLFINAMTGGGGTKTELINQQLAVVANKMNIAIAVGSQMSALKDKREKSTYQIIRKENPNGIVIANIGSEATVDDALRAIDMIEANAIQIHLNVIQELLMPEGDRSFSNQLKNIEEIIRKVHIPVIVKEVGYGISKETALQLKNIGVKYIDVGGFGGTNFSIIENARRKEAINEFNQWGISTVASIAEVKHAHPTCTIIASGGIRNGLDGVKSLVLGSSLFGMAGRLLKILMEDGIEALMDKIDSIHQQIKIALVALGVTSPIELQGKPHVFFGKTKEWIDQRLR